jgi:hypothetical protein
MSLLGLARFHTGFTIPTNDASAFRHAREDIFCLAFARLLTRWKSPASRQPPDPLFFASAVGPLIILCYSPDNPLQIYRGLPL